jgi:UDP-glucose 4-epimerase
MKFLVTGASGFIGNAVVAEILTRGHEVIAVYGPSSNLPAGTDDRIEYVKADVRDQDSFRSITDKGSVDAVIHAAGIAHRFRRIDGREYEKVNTGGVRNVAEASVGLAAGRFVLISSVLVYGRSGRVAGKPVTEENECYPADVYAKSKLDGERAALEVCRSRGIKLSILRPAPVIGEGSKGNFSRLIAAIDRRRFVWIGDGSNLKSLVYVGDVARSAVHLAENSTEDFELFNVTNKPTAMRDIVNEAADALGVNAPRIAIPRFPIQQCMRLARLTPFRSTATRLSATLETWLAEDVYSSERLSSKYSFVPSVSISEAIQREVRYYLTNKW